MTNEDDRLSGLLRIGMACALIGIALGAVLAWQHFDKWVHLLRLAPTAYGHFMLPSLALGGAAVVCAVSEIVRSGRYRGSIGVFALGIAAMATPVFLGVALIGVFVIAVIAVAISAIADA